MRVAIWQNGREISAHTLNEGSYKIGRAQECDIQLKSSRVSKQHALLIIKGNKAAIVDLGSSNGVFVNGILVKKHRIEPGDDISIVDFKIKIGAAERALHLESRMFEGPKVGPPITLGNLAHDMSAMEPIVSPHVSIPEASTPQDKLLDSVEKLMGPFDDLIKSLDWRWILGTILTSSLLVTVILSTMPVFDWGKDLITKESLNRAHTVLSQAVRENYRILVKTNDYSRLTVEVPEAEKGFLSVYIIDPDSKSILAPPKYFNKSFADNFYAAAIELILKEKKDQVSLQKNDNRYVIAQPIYIESNDPDKPNKPNVVAIILANFEVTGDVSSTFQPLVISALFALLFALLAFFLLHRQMTHPIEEMNEQLDSALKGTKTSVTCNAKFFELETLCTSINFALSRIQKDGAGLGDVSSDEADAEDELYYRTVMEFCEGSSDAILLLDTEKHVRYINPILEELVGIRNQYSQGQNISDASKDSGFAGTSIDLVDNVLKSLGQTQFATLDINGISRNMVAASHKNKNGEIRSVLITIKLGEGGK